MMDDKSDNNIQEKSSMIMTYYDHNNENPS